MKKFIASCLLFFSLLGGASANIPVGISNNNPGNIIKTHITWKGEVECNSRFECFESPEKGLRAMAINLLSHYEKRGADTPKKLLHRWSPPHENATSHLVKVFHQKTGIAPDAPLELHKRENLKSVMVAIIHQENGMNPYGSIIDNVVLELFPKQEEEIKDAPLGKCKGYLPKIVEKKKSIELRDPLFFFSKVPEREPAERDFSIIIGDRRNYYLNFL